MEPAALADAELVERIVASAPTTAGRWEAELVRRFVPRVRLYGLRHLRRADAADDLVQAELLVVLERTRAGEVRDPARLASFVLGTCRLVVQQWRRGDGHRAALLATFGADLTPAAPRPPSLDRARMGACLGRLGERERTVIVLTFYDERDADEIATALGMTPGNVRVVRHRALARLATCMGVGEDA